MIDPQIDDLEFESDSDEVGSDLDMDQIPEDREQEDSDEVHSKRVFSLDGWKSTAFSESLHYIDNDIF